MANPQVIEGEDVSILELNDVQHDLVDASVEERLSEEIITRQQEDESLLQSIGTVSGNLTTEATARENADTALGTRITEEATARGNADTALGNRITPLESGLSAETTARENADTALGNRLTTVENGLSAEVTARENADTALGNRVTAIESKIPNQASAQNQLADKDFVNSSIATNTANFLGTYSSLADIEAIQNPTNNDYAFLETTDSQGNNVYDRYKYSASEDEWLFEYELNNSSFTSGQWATINSGLTQSSVDSDIATAIGALDATQAGGEGKYIKSISETDGVIETEVGTIDSAVTASSNNPVSSDAVKTYVDAQVTQAIAQVLDTGF